MPSSTGCHRGTRPSSGAAACGVPSTCPGPLAPWRAAMSIRRRLLRPCCRSATCREPSATWEGEAAVPAARRPGQGDFRFRVPGFRFRETEKTPRLILAPPLAGLWSAVMESPLSIPAERSGAPQRRQGRVICLESSRSGPLRGEATAATGVAALHRRPRVGCADFFRRKSRNLRRRGACYRKTTAHLRGANSFMVWRGRAPTPPDRFRVPGLGGRGRRRDGCPARNPGPGTRNRSPRMEQTPRAVCPRRLSSSLLTRHASRVTSSASAAADPGRQGRGGPAWPAPAPCTPRLRPPSGLR